MTAKRKPTMLEAVGKGLRDPRKAWSFLRRSWRSRRIWAAAAGDHIAFYRRIMAEDVIHKTPRGAVGTEEESRWLRLGELQFQYLVEHGLERHHRLLEIGCGNLRAGWRLIEHLEVGAYTGTDISPEIIIAAQNTVAAYGLQEKRPHLLLIGDMGMRALPEGYFDVVHAHSVFSHTPVEVVEAAFLGVRRVIAERGFFDFTYNESAGGYWGALREDYYYPTDMLIDLAQRHGFSARKMEGWNHPQARLRLHPVQPR